MISLVTWLTGWTDPAQLRARRQRHIDALLGEAPVQLRAFQFAAAHLDGIGNAVLEPVEFGAHLAALVGIDTAQLLHQPGNRTFFAQRLDPNVVKRLQIVGVRNAVEHILAQLFNLLLHLLACLPTKQRGPWGPLVVW